MHGSSLHMSTVMVRCNPRRMIRSKADAAGYSLMLDDAGQQRSNRLHLSQPSDISSKVTRLAQTSVTVYRPEQRRPAEYMCRFPSRATGLIIP